MNKKLIIFGLFLLVSCVGVNAQTKTVSEDYVIAEKKFLEAQKKFFYQTIVEMHKNGQMTKEAIDELRQKLGIEDLKKVMEERKQKNAPQYMKIGAAGLAYGVVVLFNLYVSKVFLHCVRCDWFKKSYSDFLAKGMPTLAARLKVDLSSDEQKKKFQEDFDRGADTAFYSTLTVPIVLSVLGTGFGLNGLHKLYVNEQKRKQEVSMIEEIIKELDKVQVVGSSAHV